MPKPKVTIAVPVYREGKYLRKTLQSLKNQTFTDYVCLISDNCSPDESYLISREFCRQDERFQAFRQEENRGAVKNFLFLYEKTDTEYMMIFSGHDLIEPAFLEKTVGTLETRPEISIAFSKVMAIWEDGREVRPLDEAEYTFTGGPVSRYLQSVAALGNCTLVQGVFRRNYVEDYRFDVVCPSMDHILISHLLWYGNVHYHGGHLYKRRFFGERSTSAMERIAGTEAEAEADYRLMYDAYLDDFNALFRGDEKYRRFLNQKIIDILTRRFGLDCLLEK